MRLSFCGAVSLLCAAAATNAPACRYNVREIGFVDVQQPEFRFAVFVHGDEQKDWLPVFQKSAGSILGPSNVKWEIVDETAGPAAADLALRGLLGPRLPGGVMTASGRGEGWPVFLHFPAPELDARLATLVNSPARTEVLNATIDTYGAVLLLRGQDEPANAAARTQAREAIQATEATLADLPKRIALGPRLVECDPSLPEEQALAWSLGVNGRDLARPVVAIVYGRGRLAGTPLKDGSLTAAKMKEQLAVIGADCECLMDHAWLTTGAIPLAVPAQAGARITQALGFDPDAAPVKAEVTQILQHQAAGGGDPGRRNSGGGYRESPLEIVPIGPGLPPPASLPPAPPEGASAWKWWGLGGITAALVLFITAIWKKRETSGKPGRIE